ncbi:MAG: cation transporter [Caldisericia bacterium]|nr:cation transporter [Caldisericia bacterium]
MKSLSKEQEIRRLTLVGICVNVLLTASKIIGGLAGGSSALYTDGFHSMTDLSSDFIVLFGLKYWMRPADENHPHGHKRLETVITVVIGIMLASIGITLGYNSVLDLIAGNARQADWITFAIACMAIVTKEGMARWSVSVGTRLNSKAVLANSWDQRSDALGAIPVAISILLVRINPKLWWIDQTAAILVCALILRAAFNIIWPSLKELLDTGANKETREKITNIIKNTPGVMSVHKLKTRYLGGDIDIIVHIQVDSGMSVRDSHKITGVIKENLANSGVLLHEANIHVEPYDSSGNNK